MKKPSRCWMNYSRTRSNPNSDTAIHGARAIC
jgi:hypothetical protein